MKALAMQTAPTKGNEITGDAHCTNKRELWRLHERSGSFCFFINDFQQREARKRKKYQN